MKIFSVKFSSMVPGGRKRRNEFPLGFLIQNENICRRIPLADKYMFMRSNMYVLFLKIAFDTLKTFRRT